MMATHHLEIPQSASWEQQPAHQEESLEENAERVSELFATTMTSLAADVHALKHLTTWKDILEEDEENPSEDHNERREEFMESLCDLDDVVTAVEKKVGVLRQIVSEEQRALENLNLLHKDSLEQNENLQYLVDRCRSMKVTHNNTENNKKTKSHTNSKAAAGGKNGRSSKPTTKFPTARAPLGTASSLNAAASHETHTHVEGLSCYLDPVTVEELESVPRTTRGRVQIHVLNEALDNIEKCFHKKAVKVKKHKQLVVDSRHICLARYQKEPDEPIDDEELLQNLMVTEQELRQYCAFFLAGEGTARTVLAVLKALKRIKQVPQKKKGMFMYKLCEN